MTGVRPIISAAAAMALGGNLLGAFNARSRTSGRQMRHVTHSRRRSLINPDPTIEGHANSRLRRSLERFFIIEAYVDERVGRTYNTLSGGHSCYSLIRDVGACSWAGPRWFVHWGFSLLSEQVGTLSLLGISIWVPPY